MVFVCRKCMKRAGAEDLRGSLKEELGKRVRVVQSGCLKVCPKGRVCLVAGNGERMRVLLVDPEQDAASLGRAVSGVLDAER
ncbi:hypothetical protein P2318_20120 [Myxococcaceae bacterium GXIMD 01537]